MNLFWINEISKDLRQYVHSDCLKTGKYSKFPEPDIHNYVLMGLKPVETSTKHASKLGKTLVWVNWGDTKEEYWN